MELAIAVLRIFLAISISTDAHQLRAAKVLCPPCLNGGLCLPQKDASARIWLPAKPDKFRCFCPAPWIGAACEIKGFDVDSSLDRKESSQQISLTRQDFQGRGSIGSGSRAFDDWKGDSTSSDAFLLTLQLDGRADSLTSDSTNLRLAVYLALCPSLPCPLGLVLEDVSLLTLSPEEVRLSIAWPSRIGATTLKEELESQLSDDDSHLRAEALKGSMVEFHIEHISMEAYRAVLKVREDTKSASGNQTASPASSKRLIPQRSDRHVGLNDIHEFRSYATQCIMILATIYLLVNMASICCERFGRWLFPTSFGQLDGHTSEEASDFQLLTGVVEIMRFPVQIAVNLCLEMYIVQSRARELTHGFGDPPAWAQTCMIVTVVAFCICILTWNVAAWSKARHSTGPTWKEHGNLFWQPNWLNIFVMTVATCTISACSIALLVCAFTMTPKDCQMDSNIRNILEQSSVVPSLSQEHQVCLFLFLQYSAVKKFEDWKLFEFVFRQLSSGNLEQDRESIHRRYKGELRRFRILTKTSSFAPILNLLILAVSEVHVVTSEDETFRNVIMHLSQGALQIYTLWAFVLLILFRHDVHVPENTNGVTLASDTDFLSLIDDSDSVHCFSVGRRILLSITYVSAAILGTSIFFVSGGDGGPTVGVDWAILWIVVLIMQSIVIYMLMLVHEGFLTQVPHAELLRSAAREIEGLVGAIPMFGILFLVAYRRGLDASFNGQLPEWVFNAMNYVAQVVLLQMVVVILEASMSRLFVSPTTWDNLHHALSSERRTQVEDQRTHSFPAPPDDQRLNDSSDPFLVKPTRTGNISIADGPRRSTSELAEVLRRTGSDEQPNIDRTKTSTVHIDYEKRYLSTRLLNLTCTSLQLLLLAVNFVSCELIMIAIWTLDGNSPNRKYSSRGQSLVPLYPVSQPTSMALETMVVLICVFFAVKCSSQLVTTLRCLYSGMSWSILASFHRSDQLVDLVPIAILLCFMAHSRAVAFHGVHASPPYFVQAHMVVIIIGMVVQIASSLLSPLLTSEFTKSEASGSLIPGVRHFLLVVEQLGFFAMAWGLLVIMLAIVFMRPEYVVLSDGSNGQPWRGEGDAPSLSFPAWVLLCVCTAVFFFCVLNNICQITITRWRHTAGERREREKWHKWLRSAPFVRWLRIHHGAVLARQASIGSIVLALLFIPVSGVLRRPVLGHHSDDITQTQETILELAFFVAGILSVVKAVVAFWFGFVPAISTEKQGIIDDEEPEHAKKDGQQPLLDCPVSNDWRLSDDNKKNEFFMTQMFRRMGLAVYVLEFLTIGFLVGHLLVALRTVHTFRVDEGNVWLFSLYWITNVVWGCAQYLDMSVRRLDGLMGVVSVCPTMILLHMAIKHRVLEVAGREAAEPNWLQNLVTIASSIVFVEFILVLLTPALKAWKVSLMSPAGQTPTGSTRNLGPSPRWAEMEQTIRIGYIMARSALRVFLNAIIGGIIFGLFWMTKEQCKTSS